MHAILVSSDAETTGAGCIAGGVRRVTFLWLTRFTPYAPLKGGAYDYTRSLVESLARIGPVEGLVFAAPGVAAPEVPGLTWSAIPARSKPAIASLASRLPNVAFRNVDAGYLGEAVRRARGKDAVFVDFIAMAWIVEPLVAALGPDGPPVIVVTHNHEYAVRRQMVASERKFARRQALRLDAWKAANLERRANRAAAGVTAITEADAEAFRTETDRPCVAVPPSYSDAIREAREIGPETPMTACILGNRTSYHKIMVLEHTLAALAARGVEREISVDIVGAGDFAPYRKTYPGFNFIGFVDDLFRYLGQVRLALMTDDIGGGFKIRALSLAFARVPILALEAAMHGMGFVEGTHYIGAGTLEELAAMAPRLMADPARLNALQEAAFAHASTEFDPAVPGRRLADFAQQLGAHQLGAERAGA